MNGNASPFLYPAAAVTLVALVLLAYTGGPAIMGSSLAWAAAALALACLIAIWHPRWQLLLAGIAAHGAIFLVFTALPDVAGRAELGFWALTAAAILAAAAFVQSLIEVGRGPGAPRAIITVAVVVVILFWVLIVWEIVVRGIDSPDTMPPAPSELFGSIPRAGKAV